MNSKIEKNQIIKILSSEDDDSDNSQILLEYLEKGNWDENYSLLFDMLKKSDFSKFWNQIIITLWYAQGKNKILPVEDTIALLNYCLERSDEVDGNLVWSITRNLKKMAYDSDYDPYQDERVWKILHELKSGNEK